MILMLHHPLCIHRRQREAAPMWRLQFMIHKYYEQDISMRFGRRPSTTGEGHRRRQPLFMGQNKHTLHATPAVLHH